MKKILYVLLACTIVFNFFLLPVSAQQTNSVLVEKVWRITMDAEILNDAENLKKISVVNKKTGKAIPVNLELKENDLTLIEVTPQNIYELGEYEVTVKKGFKSASGSEVLKDVTKSFTVSQAMDVSSINGTWSTNYEYDGLLYAIEVMYQNGDAQISIIDIASGFKMTSNKPYTIEDSYMEMNVEELGFKVSGRIHFYSDKEFKVITRSGKSAYFFKNK